MRYTNQMGALFGMRPACLYIRFPSIYLYIQTESYIGWYYAC